MLDEKTLYAEKLNDERWQIVRRYILKRDNYTCQNCGLKENKGQSLQVHHKEYHEGRDPWHYMPRFLVALCKPCHRREHDLDPLPKESEDKTHIGYILLRKIAGGSR